MHLKVLLIACGLVMIFFASQVAECKDGSIIMKYGKMVNKRISRYLKPLLMGTEEFTSKVTRDVGVASKFSVRNTINAMLSANKMLQTILQYAKKKVGKKKESAAAAAPPEPEVAPAADPPPA